jgi:hypothetical protein
VPTAVHLESKSRGQCTLSSAVVSQCTLLLSMLECTDDCNSPQNALLPAMKSMTDEDSQRPQIAEVRQCLPSKHTSKQATACHPVMLLCLQQAADRHAAPPGRLTSNHHSAAAPSLRGCSGWQLLPPCLPQCRAEAVLVYAGWPHAHADCVCRHPHTNATCGSSVFAEHTCSTHTHIHTTAQWLKAAHAL